MYDMVRDPVCIMMIDEKTVQHISEVDGQKAHLCSAYCKSQLDYNPDKYSTEIILVSSAAASILM